MSAVSVHGMAADEFAYPRRYLEAACPISHGTWSNPKGCTPGTVYVARVSPGVYKIGYTVRDVSARVEEIAASMPGLRCIMSARVACAVGCEVYLHSRFLHWHRGGERFALPPDGLPLIHGMRTFGGTAVEWRSHT